MTSSLPLLALASCLLSLTDSSGLAWLIARAIVLIAAVFTPIPSLPSPPAAFAVLAWTGLPGIDLALGCLAFGFLRIPISQLSIVLIAAGGVSIVSSLASAASPGLIPATFPFNNRNHFAVFAELAIPVLFFRWTQLRYRSPWAAPFLANSLILTVLSIAGQSRAGTVCLLVLWTLLLTHYIGRRAAMIAVPVAGAAAALIFLFTSPERLLHPFTGDHRAEIYQSTIQMIAAKPLTGWGAGQFTAVYPAFALFDNGQFVNAAHSDWLQWAAEAGIVPPLLLLVFLLANFRLFQRFPVSWGILMSAAHAVIDFPFHLPGFWVFSAAFTGAIFQHAQETQARNAVTQSTRSSGKDPPSN
jgi:O-antigen ligase